MPALAAGYGAGSGSAAPPGSSPSTPPSTSPTSPGALSSLPGWRWDSHHVVDLVKAGTKSSKKVPSQNHIQFFLSLFKFFKSQSICGALLTGQAGPELEVRAERAGARAEFLARYPTVDPAHLDTLLQPVIAHPSIYLGLPYFKAEHYQPNTSARTR